MGLDLDMHTANTAEIFSDEGFLFCIGSVRWNSS